MGDEKGTEVLLAYKKKKNQFNVSFEEKKKKKISAFIKQKQQRSKAVNLM